MTALSGTGLNGRPVSDAYEVIPGAEASAQKNKLKMSLYDATAYSEG